MTGHSDEFAAAVYTASKSCHGPRWQEFRSAWADLGVRVASTWIDESGEGETADFSDLWRRCIDEASTADLLVCYHEDGEVWKGAFIEIGAALACGKPVYVIGRPPGSWIHHPLVTLATDPDDAVMDFLARADFGSPEEASDGR